MQSLVLAVLPHLVALDSMVVDLPNATARLLLCCERKALHTNGHGCAALMLPARARCTCPHAWMPRKRFTSQQYLRHGLQCRITFPLIASLLGSPMQCRRGISGAARWVSPLVWCSRESRETVVVRSIMCHSCGSTAHLVAP